MQIHEIEPAIKPQFIWLKGTERKFQTDPNIYKSQSVGIITFIAVARLLGFPDNEIRFYLNIPSQAEYIKKRNLAKYPSDLIKLKMKLTINNLKAKETKKHISLADLNF